MNLKATATKVTIYIVLLIIFFFFYMMDVLNQYANKRTNFAKYSDSVPEEGINVPALTFCFKPAFKTSQLKLHNLPSTFCIDPSLVNETNQLVLENANMTWNKFCSNISYKLGRDFTLDISDDYNSVNSDNKKIMEKGVNKDGDREVEIIEIFTKYDGLCYAMQSNLLFNNITGYYLIRITYLVGFELLLYTYILDFWL